MSVAAILIVKQPDSERPSCSAASPSRCCSPQARGCGCWSCREPGLCCRRRRGDVGHLQPRPPALVLHPSPMRRPPAIRSCSRSPRSARWSDRQWCRASVTSWGSSPTRTPTSFSRSSPATSAWSGPWSSSRASAPWAGRVPDSGARARPVRTLCRDRCHLLDTGPSRDQHRWCDRRAAVTASPPVHLLRWLLFGGRSCSVGLLFGIARHQPEKVQK